MKILLVKVIQQKASIKKTVPHKKMKRNFTHTLHFFSFLFLFFLISKERKRPHLYNYFKEKKNKMKSLPKHSHSKFSYL